jgi:myo-inositol-1(or 4)-monophosphatase
MKGNESKELFEIIKSKVLEYFYSISESGYSYKQGRELVTRADTDKNEIITGQIKKNFPENNIISEDGNCSITDSEYCWHIDPIDNSVGFIAGENEISVSISLKRADEYIQSMIINPRTGEIFEAYNAISLLNGNPIKTYHGPLSELTRGISHALM